ncbi:single-stranded DNA-binding protein [Kamptonema cortianum]|nr:single-stranded DNA-binding protein [Geitlerinema splendidum]MDK3162450.1 single-stranded DNA-binding protein [Kamptonema cortianum]
MSVNNVVLIGRLTRDPEIRTTTSGKPVANFSIAVTKRFKPQDGSPDADFFNIVAWGSSAEFVSNYLGKGRLVAVEGRLQSRRYTTQDGNQRDVVEVVADNVQGLDRPRDDQGGSGGGESHGEPVPAALDEYDPFADE